MKKREERRQRGAAGNGIKNSLSSLLFSSLLFFSLLFSFFSRAWNIDQTALFFYYLFIYLFNFFLSCLLSLLFFFILSFFISPSSSSSFFANNTQLSGRQLRVDVVSEKETRLGNVDYSAAPHGAPPLPGAIPGALPGSLAAGSAVAGPFLSTVLPQTLALGVRVSLGGATSV